MSDTIFQRNLQDLIKGIRTHKKDASVFISQAIADIKNELRSTDPFIKAEAVRKLTYLQMTGYNVSWAAFAIVEVMSQARFAHKRIGCLAANQSFDETTDVILLTTNLFKKEFTSISMNNQYEIGLAINCLANIATKDLARDCISDLVTLMNHSKPYIRKKAVLAMYKLYVKFPQGLRLTFDKLKERLDDAESSVVSTAVNVICELANKNAKNYLAMAPKFFKLLTSSSNNWMLIKVVKLLGSLVSEEPRLARKLLEPMATIIRSTGAKSLQFECIFTVTEALPHTRREDGTETANAAAVVRLCSDYLRGFVEDSDQNLKYLGLVGLANLMKSSPRSVVEHRDLVLLCLGDEDVTIRKKALELLAGIVSRKSLVELVRHLMEHVHRSEGSYRDEVVGTIMHMCRKDKYALVGDFAWYVHTLLQLAVVQGASHGAQVADQLIEIALRVDTVRPFAADAMVSLLLDAKLVLGQARATVAEVLRAAAWIVGEYSDIVTMIAGDDAADDDDGGEDSSAFWIECEAAADDKRSVWRGQNVHLLVLRALLHPRTAGLAAHVQKVYVHAAMKLFVRAAADLEMCAVASLVSAVRTGLGAFLQSPHLEVQERASSFRHLLADFGVLSLEWEEAGQNPADAGGEGEECGVADLLGLPQHAGANVLPVDERGAAVANQRKDALNCVVAENFYAVHSKAQRRVPAPGGVDLERPLAGAALDELLSVEIPSNLSLLSLSFVTATTNAIADSVGLIDRNSEFSFDRRGAASGAAASYGSESPADRAQSSLAHEAGRRGADNDVFMLGGGRPAADSALVPLSKILGDNFEEIPAAAAVGGGGDRRSRGSKKDRGGGGGKSSSGRKHSRKSAPPAVNVAEIFPAGAVASSDEEDPRGSGTGGRRRRPASNDGEAALGCVDLTTPLRPDEVISAPQHRVVSSQSGTRGSGSFIESVDAGQVGKASVGGKEEKKKKSSKSKRDKSKHKEKATGPAPGSGHEVDNLLGLAWASDPVSAASAADRVPVPHAAAAGDKKRKTSEWQSLFSDNRVAVQWTACAVDSSQLAVSFKVLNVSTDGAVVALSVSFPSMEQDSAVVASSSAVEAAAGLSPGSEARSSAQFTLRQPTAAAWIARVPCVLVLSVDSLLGPEVSTVECALDVSACHMLEPNVLSESDFARDISRSSSRWGSASVRVPITAGIRAKHAFKALAGHLRAHSVEAESSKAVSLSARSRAGDLVFVLAKRKSGNSLVVDIKCLCSCKSDSALLAETVASHVRSVVL